MRCVWDDQEGGFACPEPECTYHGDMHIMSLHLALDHQDDASLRGVKIAFYKDSEFVGWLRKS